MMQNTYLECSHLIGKAKVRYFSRQFSFRIGSLRIQPIPTSHEVDSCGFVINKFGLFTDTGIVTRQMMDAFPHLQGALLESNHDIEMLLSGPYPIHLKKWILSDKGHLSNINASQLIQERGKDLTWILLGHLSGTNNTPERAKATFETLVKRRMQYFTCSRDRETGCFVL